MTNTPRIITAVFSTLLVFATGCATDTDEAEAPDDELEAFNEAIHTESITAADKGCTKAQLKRGTDACHIACSIRKSNGIHYCVHKSGVIKVQCDCKKGNDPILTL